jgi:hypothetical protein
MTRVPTKKPRRPLEPVAEHHEEPKVPKNKHTARPPPAVRRVWRPRNRQAEPMPDGLEPEPHATPPLEGYGLGVNKASEGQSHQGELPDEAPHEEVLTRKDTGEEFIKAAERHGEENLWGNTPAFVEEKPQGDEKAHGSERGEKAQGGEKAQAGDKSNAGEKAHGQEKPSAQTGPQTQAFSKPALTSLTPQQAVAARTPDLRNLRPTAGVAQTKLSGDMARFEPPPDAFALLKDAREAGVLFREDAHQEGHSEDADDPALAEAVEECIRLCFGVAGILRIGPGRNDKEEPIIVVVAARGFSHGSLASVPVDVRGFVTTVAVPFELLPLKRDIAT